MKKLLLLAALALFCAGTATVMTVHPHWAVADCGSGGCSP